VFSVGSTPKPYNEDPKKTGSQLGFETAASQVGSLGEEDSRDGTETSE
jgi:hypothetical protein